MEVNEGGAVAAKAVEGRRVRDAAAPAAIRSISRRLISLSVILIDWFLDNRGDRRHVEIPEYLAPLLIFHVDDFLIDNSSIF